jgi:hypothetical protein
MRPYAKPKVDHRDADKDYWEPELFPVHQRQVKKPTDLFWPFPVGEPLALAVPTPYARYYTLDKKESWNTLMEGVVYNKDVSPWRSCLADSYIVYNKNGYVSGIVFTETDFDPTVMVNMNRKVANNIGQTYDHIHNFEWYLSKGASPLEAFLLTHGMYRDGKMLSQNSNTYTALGDEPDYARLLQGLPNDLTDGGTFRQRYAYNRPKNDYLFSGQQDFARLVGKKLGRKGDRIAFTESELPTILETMRELAVAPISIAA